VRGYIRYIEMSKTTALAINERRQKLWSLLTRGLNTYEIAKELDVDHCNISRDIKYLTEQSQDYLNDLAKQMLPFMYQTSIEGIRDIIKEYYNIYSLTFYSSLAIFNTDKNKTRYNLSHQPLMLIYTQSSEP
jgi:IS30 family transposase